MKHQNWAYLSSREIDVESLGDPREIITEYKTVGYG